MKQRIAFALISYMPRTYTWVYNQLRFFKSTHVSILSTALHPDRKYFHLKYQDLFSCPGFEVLKNPGIARRVIRRLLWFVLVDSRLDLLIFAWQVKIKRCALIHAHFANVGWKFIPVARMLKVPLVTAFYGYDYEHLPNIQPVWKQRYLALFKHGTLFLTEGEYGRASLIEKGLDPDKVKVHHLGIDVDNIPFSLRSLKQGEVLRLVQTASLVEKKGQKTVIEALGVLKEKGCVRDVSMVFIGDGPQKQILMDRVKKHNLEKQVTFINHIPYENLHLELLKYHVFVHPSVMASNGDCEGGAPVVLLDAQATGMPVISTYHCDIPEEVIDGKTGLLVPENDYNALADTILHLLKNTDIIGQYGTAGRRHVEMNYSAIKQAELLEKIYSDLIGN